MSFDLGICGFLAIGLTSSVSRNTTNVMSSVSHIRCLMGHCLIISDINFDYHVKVVVTSSFNCTVSIFPFVINNMWEDAQISM